MSNNGVSRRSAIQATSVAAASAFVFGVPGKAMARVQSTNQPPVHPQLLRKQIVTVAAVQLQHEPGEHAEHDIRSVVEAVPVLAGQVGSLDIAVFGNVAPNALELSPDLVSHLQQCAEVHGCHLVLVGKDPEQGGVLVTSNGKIFVAEADFPLVVATDTGTLAVVSGQQTAGMFEHVSAAGAEIVIRADTVGYSIRDLQLSCMQNEMSAVVVTPSRHDPKRDDSATAIVSSSGDVLTRVGPQWEQSVIAKLPVARLRKQRQAQTALLNS